MNVPSVNWLQQLNSQLNGNQPPANEYPSLATIGGMPPPPPSVTAPPAPAPPPPGANMSLPTDDPSALMSRPPPVASQGPAPIPTGVEQPPPAPSTPDDVQFRQVGGGAHPAGEAYLRGPKQDEHLMASFEPPVQAADRVDFRNQIMADKAEAEYERQAADALARQDAADRLLAQRQFQQQQLMSDYQDQIQKLGQMHLDDNRWWAKKSTGDKISTILLTFLGGLASLDPKGNGQNLVYNRVLQEMDNDVAAQKFDYDTALNQAKGIQNAYAMMKDRYGTDDAAIAASRAAALDFAAAKVNALHAQYGGAESANARDQLVGQLGAEREKTIAAGFKFIPAGTQPGKYKMVIRGQEVPGLVDEKTAQTYAIEHGVKPSEAIDQEMVKGGIQSTIQQQKLAAEQAAKGKENAVVMPNGETVMAPDAAEAKALRDLVISTGNTKRLVAEAQKIRNDSAFRVTPASRARLAQIQSELLTDFGVQHQLGALSDKDYEMAQAGTADLFNVGSAVESRLQRLNEQATAKLQARVRTIPGAPANASGRLSDAAKASFTAYGSKK
jgi:hypothetical protein